MPFEIFGPAHLLALLLAIAVPTALVALARVRPEADRAIRWTLAAALAGFWAWWYVFAGSRGWLSLANALPLNLCDWATAAAIVTLVYPNRKSYALAYFWALGGTVQAALTPNLAYGFPDPRFLIFFACHDGVIAAVLYLTFGTRLRPTPDLLPRVVAWSFVYLFAAGAADFAFGANYGFLRAAPAHLSLFDVLSPWPSYIPELVGIAVLSMAICYAPWFVTDRILASHPQRTGLRKIHAAGN